MYDWDKVVKTQSSGVRKERSSGAEPFCRDEYIEYWAERAPKYRRPSPKQKMDVYGCRMLASAVCDCQTCRF